MQALAAAAATYGDAAAAKGLVDTGGECAYVPAVIAACLSVGCQPVVCMCGVVSGRVPASIILMCLPHAPSHWLLLVFAADVSFEQFAQAFAKPSQVRLLPSCFQRGDADTCTVLKLQVYSCQHTVFMCHNTWQRQLR